jgi:hypothetical protein
MQMVQRKKSKAPSSALIWVRDDTNHSICCLLTSSPSGTTNSAVAVMEGKIPKIIENSEGEFANHAKITSFILRLLQVLARHPRLLLLRKMESASLEFQQSVRLWLTQRTLYLPQKD